MSQLPGVPHFKLFGIPVRVEPLFLLLPLMSITSVGVRAALVWTALVFVGVLVHELGHALAMRRFGFAPAITLHLMGGWTHYPPGARPTPKQTFFITLAGPGAGLALGLVALLLQQVVTDAPPLLETALSDAVWINVGWSFVNLLPILPWDGGIILDSALAWSTGARRHVLVGGASVLGGATFVVFAILKRSVILGYFGGMGVWHGWTRLRLSGQLRSALDAQRSGQGWWERLHSGDEVEAELRAELARASTPEQRAQLAELLAWACLRKRDYAGARAAVAQLGTHLPSVSLRARLAAADNDSRRVIELLSGDVSETDLPLLVSALIQQERLDDVVALGLKHRPVADLAATRLFEAGAFTHALELCTAERTRTGLGRFAYNEACCLCRLGRLDDAVTALQKARTLGCAELERLDQDDDLAPVRERPEVRALLT